MPTDSSPATTETADRPRDWWGSFTIDRGAAITWTLGPLDLRIDRQEHEWQIRHRSSGDALDTRLQIAEPADALDPDLSWESISRVASGADAAGLELTALTADRAIVSRPVDPFFVLPAETVRLFVSTPLWIGIDCGAGRVAEFPISRPSDTWVGPNIGPGQAAYANRTRCRQEIVELPIRPHRAITPVLVHNRAGDMLALERIVLNVPLLSLFACRAGRIWTEEIQISMRDGNELESEIHTGPPAEVDASRPISNHRLAHPGTRLGRTLASIF